MIHKAGIIGYGNMGSWHAENVSKRISGLEVSAVYDIRPEKLKKAEADSFTVYRTQEEFFASGIDTVIIATPNNFHKYYAVKALNSGKNVVCEKPACMNMVELEEIFTAAKQNGKFFTVHQNRRFDLDYAIIKEVIENGTVGKPHCLCSRLYSNKGISGDWRSSAEAGGGCLFDWGSHLIDQIVCIIKSKPVSVYARLQNVRFKSIDDICRIIINFENGLSAEVVADLWCYINEGRWHLSGDDGTAVIERWWEKDGRIIKGNIKQVDWFEGCVYTPNGVSRTMWPRPKQEITELPLPLPKEEPRWEEFYENFIETIEGKAEPFVTQEQIKTTLSIIMAAFESARKDQVIRLD